MSQSLMISPVAYIYNPYSEKFGVPRQSGCVEEVVSRIVFEPPYRNPDAFRGLEDYSHLWLIWEFSLARRTRFSATVRPPRLGGNSRLGVFATRSPFRPNPLGLSCVRLLEVTCTQQEGPVLIVGGADLMNGTPILDVKPYLPYTDAHPEAMGGFTQNLEEHLLQVEISEALRNRIPTQLQEPLIRVLMQDPRPRYQEDPDRNYGMSFGGFNIRFRVYKEKLIVTGIDEPEQSVEAGIHMAVGSIKKEELKRS